MGGGYLPAVLLLWFFSVVECESDFIEILIAEIFFVHQICLSIIVQLLNTETK